MVHIVENVYSSLVPKVIQAYKSKGMNIGGDQAIDIIHRRGINGSWKDPKKEYIRINPETVGFNSQTRASSEKPFKLGEASGINLKNVSPELKTAAGELFSRLGLSSGEATISSGYRHEDSGKHGSGNALDIVTPKGKNRDQQDLNIIHKIADLYAPEQRQQVINMLLAGKGTNGRGIKPVSFIRGGKTYNIIYHKNENSEGNHFHINVSS